MEGCLF